MLPIRNVTYTKCYLDEMLLYENVLYEMLLILAECTMYNVPPYLVYIIVNTSKLVFRMYVAVWRIVGWQLDRVQGPSKLGIAK